MLLLYIPRLSKNSVTAQARFFSTAISGRATSVASATHASRHQHLPFSVVPKTGWNLSRIGLGGFRINEDHENLTKVILRKGVNVLDTSPQFGNGASEKVIGNAIRSLVSKSEIKREEFVIITKAGYLHPQTVQSYSIPSSAYVCVNDNDLLHTVESTAIELSITESLKRLGVETIDVFMLSNPERMMAGKQPWTRMKLYEELQKTFRHLDTEVSRGRIASYGVCSNSLFTTSAHDHISLADILGIIDKLENFVAIQAPFNLFERDAVGYGSLAQEDNERSRKIIQLVKENRLYLFANRPLNAITRNQICNLSNFDPNPSQSEKILLDNLMTQFQNTVELETEISTALPMNEQILASKFIWGQVLAENLASLSQNEFAARHYIRQMVLPSLSSDLEQLKSYIHRVEDKDESGELQIWAGKYQDQINTLINSLNSYILATVNQRNSELDAVLAVTAPSLSKGAETANSPLSVKALRVALANDKIGTVLVGMRKSEYVEDAMLAASLSVNLPLSEEEINDVFTCPLIV